MQKGTEKEKKATKKRKEKKGKEKGGEEYLWLEEHTHIEIE